MAVDQWDQGGCIPTLKFEGSIANPRTWCESNAVGGIRSGHGEIVVAALAKVVEVLDGREIHGRKRIDRDRSGSDGGAGRIANGVLAGRAVDNQGVAGSRVLPVHVDPRCGGA